MSDELLNILKQSEKILVEMSTASNEYSNAVAELELANKRSKTATNKLREIKYKLCEKLPFVSSPYKKEIEELLAGFQC